MANAHGHTPSWPPYYLSKYVYKKLYFLEGKAIYDENGCKTPIADYEELVSILFAQHALLFTSSLASPLAFPWLRDAIVDDHSVVSCTKKGKATAVTIRGPQNRTAKIASIRSWKDRKAVLDTEFLREMQELFEYCGVGSYATPGALGKALMLNMWGGLGLDRHSAPNLMCQKFLWTHHTGGRCDTLGKLWNERTQTGYIYPETIELDMSSAYLAHFMQHPTGTSQSVLGEAAWEYPTFFVECEVTIPSELPLGPFPVRRKKGAMIDYPAGRGTYHTFLWREQILDCLQCGCNVALFRGYGWNSFTQDNSFWSRAMYQDRIRCENRVIEGYIKNIIVAAIGRHGMHGEFWQLVPDSQRKEEDDILIDDLTHEATIFWIQKQIDHSSPAMTHWFSYTIMQCARSLWRYSLPYALDGSLLMTNYDALLVDRADPPEGIPEKHSLASLMCKAGDLRWQRLTNVKILGSRSLKCDQKIKRPGVPLEEVA